MTLVVHCVRIEAGSSSRLANGDRDGCWMAWAIWRWEIECATRAWSAFSIVGAQPSLGLGVTVKLSVVIPALNEERCIADVLKEIPLSELAEMDYDVELIVVDNGSDDYTAHVACVHGASVVVQPVRGYGNAYRAGFAYATGDVVATGDADLTYPFADLPKILKLMEQQDLEFITTDRLSGLRDGVMTRSHIFGNWLLSLTTKALFRWPYRDSQSGMWIFKRHVWHALDVQSSGMPFSQEVKIEAFLKGFKCEELPIDYRARAGETKLNTITDGLGNNAQLVKKRSSLGLVPGRSAAVRGSDVAAGEAAGAHAPDPAASLDRATSRIWDERWYDVKAHSNVPDVEAGRRVPERIVVGSKADGSTASEQRPMVVWRAERRRRPRTASTLAYVREAVSRAADGVPGEPLAEFADGRMN